MSYCTRCGNVLSIQRQFDDVLCYACMIRQVKAADFISSQLRHEKNVYPLPTCIQDMISNYVGHC